MIAHTEPCTCLSFNTLGDTLATGGADKLVKLWSIKNKKIHEATSLKSKTNSICALSFSIDNDYLMACTTDHRATLYRLKGQIKAQLSFEAHKDLITSTKFSFSQRQVITASHDFFIKFWDINKGDISRSINSKSKVFDMHISRSETHVVSGHNDCSVKIWNTRTKDMVFQLEDAHADPVSCVRFTPDEMTIVSMSKDDCLKVWDLRMQKLLHTFEHDKFKVGSIQNKFCVSPNS
jgi:WD40 repeat protein